MALNTDTLLDRIKLKQQLRSWRVVAVAALVLAAVAFFGRGHGVAATAGDYIARITIEGMIIEDSYRDSALKDLQDDHEAVAVVVHINSPGGTVAAGESLYKQLQAISKQKPVVVVMRSLATSAGYMITLGTDRVFASPGSLTGSIGVLLQTVEATDLADKIGIKAITLRSGAMKGQFSPLEKTSREAIAVMQKVIDDYYEHFLSLILAHRPISEEELRPLADGRVYTGQQALELKLVDAIGDEGDAVNWLSEARNIDEDTHIRDVSLTKPESPFAKMFESVFTGPLTNSVSNALPLQGLVSVWQPGIAIHP